MSWLLNIGTTALGAGIGFVIAGALWNWKTGRDLRRREIRLARAIETFRREVETILERMRQNRAL